MKNQLYFKRFWGIITSPVRMLPDFLIIGGRKCGSTSLYNYLIQHPCVASPLRKEMHFFSTKFHKNLAWYKANFPSTRYKSCSNKNQKKNFITCDASAEYLSYPNVAERVHQIIPKVKLIAILRNPIERAFSDWKYAAKEETLSFEEAIKNEKARLAVEKEKILEDPHYITHWAQAYTTQGIYIDQLKRWFELFPKKQILILKSEDFFSNTESILKEVCQFLNLESFKLREYKPYNFTNPSITMDTKTRNKLKEFFKPHNERLYEFLDRRFDWD